MTKQMCWSRQSSTCGSRTYTMQKNKNILTLLAAVIHDNKCKPMAIAKRLCTLGLAHSLHVLNLQCWLHGCCSKAT